MDYREWPDWPQGASEMTKTFTSGRLFNRVLKGLCLISALINNGGNSSMNNIIYMPHLKKISPDQSPF